MYYTGFLFCVIFAVFVYFIFCTHGFVPMLQFLDLFLSLLTIFSHVYTENSVSNNWVRTKQPTSSNLKRIKKRCFFKHSWSDLKPWIWWTRNNPVVKKKGIFKNKRLWQFDVANFDDSRTQKPRGLRRRSVAARLPGFRFRIPLMAWMSVFCVCCMLSSRSLCDGLIARPEESYWVWSDATITSSPAMSR